MARGTGLLKQGLWVQVPAEVRCELLGCPVQGQEVNSMILVGPFQLSTFYDYLSSKPTV